MSPGKYGKQLAQHNLIDEQNDGSWRFGIFVGVGVQLALRLAADASNHQGWKDPERPRFPLSTAPELILGLH